MSEIAPGIHMGIDYVPEENWWDVSGDLRRPGSGFSDDANYECRDALKPMFPNIDFDPETSCFYAYAKTEEEAHALLDAITSWVVGR